MIRLSHRISISAALLAFALPGIYAGAVAQDRTVIGDTLLVERAQVEPAHQPRRGMSMAQVEARFGVPTQRLDPRGGQKRAWPTINRWMYPGFTVYFERTKVIDVVMTKASTYEVGPKPPTS